MRHIRGTFGAVLLLFGALSQGLFAFAEEEGDTSLIYGNMTYIEKADGTLEITGLVEDTWKTDTRFDLSIPSEIGGEAVTSIGEKAFAYQDALVNVTLPNTLTTLSEKAFYTCRNLTTICLQEGIVTIGDDAFLLDQSLETLVIPESALDIGTYAFAGTGITELQLPSHLTEIPEGLLESCKSLEVVEIPDSVTTIGAEAFAYMDALEKIVLPATLVSIGDEAFRQTESLTSLTIPGTVRTLGTGFLKQSGITEVTITAGITALPERAFYECKSLTTVSLPDSLTSIGDYCFYRCESLTDINVPSHLKSIGESAFQITAITDFLLSDGVTEIGAAAFHACTALTEFYIPTGVTEVYNSVLGNCYGMKTLRIGDTLENIWEDDLYSATSLESITVSENNPYLCDIDGVLYNKSKTELRFFPIGKDVESYTIPDGVTTICNYAMDNRQKVTQLYLPSSLRTIEAHGLFNREGDSVLTDIWYDGTQEEWECLVTVEDGNHALETAALHFKDAPVVEPIVAEGVYASGDSLPELTLSENSTPGTIQWTAENSEMLHGGMNRLQWKYVPEDTQMYATRTGTIGVQASYAEGEGLLGDVDGSGAADAEDAYQVPLYYTKHAVGETAYCFPGSEGSEQLVASLADVNGDGEITAEDAYVILLYYAKMSVGADDVQWEDLI